MTPERITNNIRRLRFEHGEMTQAELARLADVSRQTVNAMEAGGYNPSLILALRIARIFGVSVEDVFNYEPREA